MNWKLILQLSMFGLAMGRRLSQRFGWSFSSIAPTSLQSAREAGISFTACCSESRIPSGLLPRTFSWLTDTSRVMRERRRRCNKGRWPRTPAA